MGLFSSIFGPNIKKLEKNKDIDGLVKVLKHKDSYYQQSAANALVRIGDESIPGIVIDYLFDESFLFYDKSYTHGKTYIHNNIEYMFGDYVQHIRNVTSKWISCDEVQKLCDINTPVSSNLLYKIAQRKDFERRYSAIVGHSKGYTDDGHTASIPVWENQVENVSLADERSLAREELKRRGNPLYDHSAYLEEDAWKLG